MNFDTDDVPYDQRQILYQWKPMNEDTRSSERPIRRTT